MPNFDSFLPVEMYRCVLGSTSGLTRRGDGRDPVHRRGHAGDRLKLGLALDVEHQDAGLEPGGDLLVGLAHAGEDRLRRARPRPVSTR